MTLADFEGQQIAYISKCVVDSTIKIVMKNGNELIFKAELTSYGDPNLVLEATEIKKTIL